ncbi:TIGR04076 family protein [Bacteroidota bacterium]
MARIKVIVERIDGYCDMPMLVGDHFFLDGSKISVPEGKFICMWALQSLMPVFSIFNVKEKLDEGHWIKSVKHFCCPDPKGKVIFRLEKEDNL